MPTNQNKWLRLCHLNTPLEHAPRLGAQIGLTNLYIKRDDCTGLAGGGNKARKLDFLIADAKAIGATVVLTTGAMQSNHVRQTAAAASRAGLRCEVFLENRLPNAGLAYHHSGNILLDHLLGANLHIFDLGADLAVIMHELARQLQEQGEVPYIIPAGGSNVVGSMGYVAAARELMRQADESKISLDYVVHASGSGGTQAGLLSGFADEGRDVRVLGMSVRAGREEMETRIYDLASQVSAVVSDNSQVGRDQVVVNADYIGPGYGQITQGIIEAVSSAARLEGLLLDPVYTGKAMHGLIDLALQGFFLPSDNVVFLHTGGTPALFAYGEHFLTASEGPK